MLASGSENTTVLVWRLAEVLGDGRKLPQFSEPSEVWSSLWADLADDDAAKAYRAVYTLIGGGKESVAFLQQQLKPSSIGPQRIPRLLADLDNEEFAVREKASDELAKLGEEALPALQKALEGNLRQRCGIVSRHC